MVMETFVGGNHPNEEKEKIMSSHGRLLVLALLTLLLPAQALAQAPPGAQPPPPPLPPMGPPGGAPPGQGGPDPISRYLYPVEIIMHNQGAIGLTGEQRETIKDEMDSSQSRFRDLNWEVMKELETLEGLLKASRVNEEAALNQLEKMTSIEDRIKREHLGLLIRVKNLLSAKQRSLLDRLKSAHHGPGGPPPHQPPPQAPHQ